MINRFLYQLFYPLLARQVRLPRLNGPCFLLGSAPNPTLPVGFDANWSYWSVNASQAGGRNLGLTTPELTVMSAQMLGSQPANLAGKAALQGLQSKQLVIIERGLNHKQVLAILNQINYGAERCHLLTHLQRAALTRCCLGEDLALGNGEEKISTGLFSMLLALNQGANPLVVSGFSLQNGGHSYNAHQHKRGHVAYDTYAIKLMRKKNFPIFTTDAEFSESSDLELWKG